MRVNEIFGPTLQGEGPSAGTQAAFLRLAGCNLDCVWCDTAYAWDWSRFDVAEEMHAMPVEDVRDALRDIGAPLVVITGGEPMLQQRAISVLSREMSFSYAIEIETNGTISPIDDLWAEVSFNVSPKLRNSGVEYGRRIKPHVLRELGQTESAILKPVVSSVDELDEVAHLQELMQVEDENVWVMPLGTTRYMLHERSTAIIDAVLARGWNFTGRLHIELWEGERGR